MYNVVSFYMDRKAYYCFLHLFYTLENYMSFDKIGCVQGGMAVDKMTRL